MSRPASRGLGRRAGLLAGILLIGCAAIAQASRPAMEVAGARFAATAGADPVLPLRGVGLLRFGLFFDVYAAALYADHAVPADALLADDRPKELVIHYLRSVERERIIEAAERHLEQSLDPDQRRRLAPALRRWHGSMRGVSAGDRYAMRYAGGRLSLSLNGELLIETDDAVLARAYFGIWLDESTPAPRLRSDLLAVSD